MVDWAKPWGLLIGWTLVGIEIGKCDRSCWAVWGRSLCRQALIYKGFQAKCTWSSHRVPQLAAQGICYNQSTIHILSWGSELSSHPFFHHWWRRTLCIMLFPSVLNYFWECHLKKWRKLLYFRNLFLLILELEYDLHHWFLQGQINIWFRVGFWKFLSFDYLHKFAE